MKLYILSVIFVSVYAETCLRHQESLTGEPGEYVPQCKENGLYKHKQCHKEECWCVDDKTGNEIYGTRSDKSTFSLGCRKHKTPCQLAQSRRSWSPECEADGSYAKEQCNEDGCYCVNQEDGALIKGSRRSSRDKLRCTYGTCANMQSESADDDEDVPMCDKNGNFVRRQCDKYLILCWCVDRITGEKIADTTESRKFFAYDCNSTPPIKRAYCDVEPIENGFIQGINSEFKTRARRPIVYKCIQGFTLVGESKRRCKRKGYLSNEKPSCVPK